MVSRSSKTTAPTAPSPVAAGDEPQTLFMPPPEGGSYVRNPDGSLTRVESPTKIPAFNPSAPKE